MNNLRVSIIQSDLYWENVSANLANFEEKIAQLSHPTDLIVLPEMFNTGFSMSVSEPMNHITHKWLKQMAQRYNCSICGSLAISEKGKKVNRLFIVNEKGETFNYDKKNLFVIGDETLTFTPGETKSQLILKEWNILPLVCFDLRFPEWARNNKNGYECLIYVASWPKSRTHHWRSLLMARAIENQSYVIGVNRIGRDGNGLAHGGASMIIDFEGNILFDAIDLENTATINLNLENLINYRNKFPFLVD